MFRDRRGFKDDISLTAESTWKRPGWISSASRSRKTKTYGKLSSTTLSCRSACARRYVAHQLAKVERKTGTQVYWMILFLLPNCRESRFGAMPRNVSSRCEAEEISRRFSPSRMILGKWRQEAVDHSKTWTLECNIPRLNWDVFSNFKLVLCFFQFLKLDNCWWDGWVCFGADKSCLAKKCKNTWCLDPHINLGGISGTFVLSTLWVHNSALDHPIGLIYVETCQLNQSAVCFIFVKVK